MSYLTLRYRILVLRLLITILNFLTKKTFDADAHNYSREADGFIKILEDEIEDLID